MRLMGAAFPDFYISDVLFPIDASGKYGIRFFAVDNSDNKYEKTFLDTSLIVRKPVYQSGGGVTKSGPTTSVSIGDVYTCDVGDWLYNPNTTEFPITCAWSIPGREPVLGTSVEVTRDNGFLDTLPIVTIVVANGVVSFSNLTDFLVKDSTTYNIFALRRGIPIFNHPK